MRGRSFIGLSVSGALEGGAGFATAGSALTKVPATDATDTSALTLAEPILRTKGYSVVVLSNDCPIGKGLPGEVVLEKCH